MIGAVMTAAKFGYAAFSGVDALVDATAQYAVKLALRSKAVDTAAAEQMVAEMRARVPQDTGRLFNGITFEVQGNAVVVMASAVSADGGANYAPYVEHGTLHMEAEPYFYEPADDILAERGRSLEAAIDAAADDFR